MTRLAVTLAILVGLGLFVWLVARSTPESRAQAVMPVEHAPNYATRNLPHLVAVLARRAPDHRCQRARGRGGRTPHGLRRHPSQDRWQRPHKAGGR
jgi:hypothetical protein